MKKIFTLISTVLFFITQSIAQDGLPVEYQCIFKGIPHMGPKKYERDKKTEPDSSTLKAFVVCDESYYLFRRENSIEYELLYMNGDDRMVLSTICFNSDSSFQTINQFLFKEPEHLKKLDVVLFDIFHIGDE
jgi:hypothetical protein